MKSPRRDRTHRSGARTDSRRQGPTVRPSETTLDRRSHAAVAGTERHRWRSVVAALVVALLAVWSLQVPALALDPDAAPAAAGPDADAGPTSGQTESAPEAPAPDATSPADPGDEAPGDEAPGDEVPGGEVPGGDDPVAPSAGASSDERGEISGGPASASDADDAGVPPVAPGSGATAHGGGDDDAGVPSVAPGSGTAAHDGGDDGAEVAPVVPGSGTTTHGGGESPGSDAGVGEVAPLVEGSTTPALEGPEGDEATEAAADSDGAGDPSTLAAGDEPAGADAADGDESSEDEVPEILADSTDVDSAEVEAAISTVLDEGVQILHSGNAVAVGNLSDDRVVQVVDVLVFDGASVWVEQIVIIVNVGQAVASTGGNTVAGGTVTGTPSSVAQVTTSDAIAIGNASETELDQQLAIDVDGGATTGDQYAGVTNSGVAIARSGGNVAIAGGSGTGSVAMSTGNAYALGNFADNQIEQGATVAATGSASVATDQQSIVINRGLARADSGDNTALAGSGGLAASSTTTGVAVAEGNVSTTTVEQRVVAIATGDASITMRQGALVLNLGVAAASTGGNQVGALAGPGTVTTSLDELDDGLLSMVLMDLGALDELASWFAAWLGPMIGHDLTVDRATVREHVVASGSFAMSADDDPSAVGEDGEVADTDAHEQADGDEEADVDGEADGVEEESGGGSWLRQLALILDLGFASANTGDNVVTEAGPAPADEPAGTLAAESRAIVVSGEGVAFGNVAVTLVCQRLRVSATLDARSCVPPPPVQPDGPPLEVDPDVPELAGPVVPDPAPADPAPVDSVPVDDEPVEVEGDVAQRPVSEPTPAVVVERVAPMATPVRSLARDAGAAALPRTGVDATTLGIGGIAAVLGGLLALVAARPAPRRGSRHRASTLPR